MPLLPRPRIQNSFIFEITQRCNYDCLHCYNCWKGRADYPIGESPVDETLTTLGRMLDETGASLVSISGGEPLLREDLFEVVDFLAARGAAVNLISNGSLLDEAAIARFARNVAIYELPLLSADRAIHDCMSSAAGAFDRVTMAIANLKAARQCVVCVFVATRLNLPTWQRTAELAIALGVDGIMFNRFNPGGRGYTNLNLLQASPEELSIALDEAEMMSEKYELPIACSIAMPACLFNTGKFKRLTFGFCAVGTERAYYTLDPLGNLRPCNHSPMILGNIRQTGFWTMADSAAMKAFVSARPELCAGCKLELECQGGCKAAAQACCGSASACDPFLAAFQGQAAKPH